MQQGCRNHQLFPLDKIPARRDLLLLDRWLGEGKETSLGIKQENLLAREKPLLTPRKYDSLKVPKVDRVIVIFMAGICLLRARYSKKDGARV